MTNYLIPNIVCKYARTPHLAWSEGISPDDIVLSNENMFDDKNVVVTEKVDGECTSWYTDKIHARSLDSKDHPSRHLVKSLWARIKHNIPDGMRIVGENVFAQHSIYYNSLPSVFLVFAIFDGETCVSWNELISFCEMLGLNHVPVLYQGKWDKDKVMKCFTGKSVYGDIQEGYVVRNFDCFLNKDFDLNVAKFVRKNHVQTNNHWMSQKIVPNKIIEANYV